MVEPGRPVPDREGEQMDSTTMQERARRRAAQRWAGRTTWLRGDVLETVVATVLHNMRTNGWADIHKRAEDALDTEATIREATSDLRAPGGFLDTEAGYVQAADPSGGAAVAWAIPYHPVPTQDGTRARYTDPTTAMRAMIRDAADPDNASPYIVETLEPGRWGVEPHPAAWRIGRYGRGVEPQPSYIGTVYDNAHTDPAQRAAMIHRAAGRRGGRPTTNPGPDAASKRALRERRDRERRALERGVDAATLAAERTAYVKSKGLAEDIERRALEWLAQASAGWDQDKRR